MKQIFGASRTGNLKEAVRGISKPDFLILMSNTEQFESHVEELEILYPGVPSIGCIGMSYDTSVVEKGVGVVAMEGVKAVANVLEQVSVMPVKYIQRLQGDVKAVGASSQNTVCIDLCAGNDACVLTTIYSVLGKQQIPLVGGTGDGGKISANGRIYDDAAAYALVKNQGGKVKVYKENMYRPMDNCHLIASKTNRGEYIIGELNGKSAKQVYMDALNIQEKDITTQTFKNPFGKITGQDMCIISIKEVVGDALACFRQVNDSDVLTLLELKDYTEIVKETIQNIHRDFPHISAVFSVNCLFRYLLFSQNNTMKEYLKDMSELGAHAGLVGYGEHYNNQFVNQSMTCVVFE
ncbi:MAG: FIST N-terminal domain-containing protein [Eubacteriales bacterium]|nr:FIST N-terminal domain-containing protein [Eubacteriales bacterium]